MFAIFGFAVLDASSDKQLDRVHFLYAITFRSPLHIWRTRSAPFRCEHHTSRVRMARDGGACLDLGDLDYLVGTLQRLKSGGGGRLPAKTDGQGFWHDMYVYRKKVLRVYKC